MIQSPSKDLTLIVYNSPRRPRYYQLNKRLLKVVLVTVPLLTFISICISFFYSLLLKGQITKMESSVPVQIQRLSSENEMLKAQNKDITKNNLTLTKKISQGLGEETPITSLGLFTIPTGLQDIRDQKLIKIENIFLESENDIINLKFDLTNNTLDGRKLSGHLYVIQFQENIIQYYPDVQLQEKNLRLEFALGESFGFTRFRNTNASFKKISSKKVKYKVFVFSRDGDFLHYQQLGPFNTETL